jgi:hypothetical protein
MTLPDVIAPYSSGSAPPKGGGGNKIHGRVYDYVLTGDNYLASTLNSLASIYVSNSCVLYVTGDFSLSHVVFAPGTKLDLYAGGTTVPCPTLYNELTNASFTLSTAVAPSQFRVLGLNSCTTLSMTGGDIFVGVLYAPHVSMNTGGNAAVFGAMTVNTFSCNGTFDFHYDLALKSSPSSTTMVILSWAEQ